MALHETITNQAAGHVDALFARMAKHGQFMMGGILFKPEMRETVIAIARTITEPLEQRIAEQERQILELRAMINDIRQSR